MRLIALLRKLAKAFARKGKRPAAFEARREGACENDAFPRSQLRARW
jgi:hypothetical protein